jgi:hypothetical protein
MGAATMPARPLALPPAAAGWRVEVAIVFGLVACEILLDNFRVYNVFVFPGPASFLLQLADVVARGVLAVPVLACALHLATRLPGGGPGGSGGSGGWRRSATAITLMVGAGAASAAVSIYALPYEPLYVTAGASASTTVALWYEVWVRTMLALLALLIVRRLGARRLAVQRLAERQEHGRVVRQRLAYAQLQAIQARVDPQLLFDMLAAVKRYYQHDAQRAERLLDELTTFLRAALPRLRSARSSLEVEFALVGCYVRMLRAAGDAAIEFEESLPEALANAVFPAGLLLPLMTRAERCAGADRRIALDAQAQGEAALRVCVSDAVAPDGAALERLRASLADLYGERAGLRVRPLGLAGAEIELEVPREHE